MENADKREALALTIIDLLNDDQLLLATSFRGKRASERVFRFDLTGREQRDCDRCGGDGSADCDLCVDDWTGDSTGCSTFMTDSTGGDVLFVVSCWPTFLSNNRYLVKAWWYFVITSAGES